MKKTVCLLIAAVILAGIIPIPASAGSVIEGKFTYTPAYEEPTEETFFYSDDYFTKSGNEFDPHLLSTSYCLSLSTFETRGFSYTAKFYEDIGFSDVSAADMEEKPTRDSIGTVIAHKKIGEKNVIAVAIRGEKYDSEWASNFTIGTDGDMKGLSDSAAKVIGRLKEYVEANGLTDNKIWIVGYSRAGAVADLAGVYLNYHLSWFGVTSDDLYVFAFEPPAASVDAADFSNIRCVVNVNDIVPHLYPALWGFGLNGDIITIGEAETVTTYQKLTAPEEYGSADVPALLAESFDWLASRISREEYSVGAEGPISDLLHIFFAKSPEDRTRILNFLTEDCLPYFTSDESKGKLTSPVWSVMGHNSDYLYGVIADIITGFLDDLRGTENAAALTDAEFETLKDAVYPIIRTFGPVVVDDTNYYEGIDYDEYYRTFAPDYLISDEEMGTKGGEESGRSDGYDAGYAGEEYNDEPQYADESYGPVYLEAFGEAYSAAYAEAYELGRSHAADPALKGEYDGRRAGAESGFFEAKEGEERTPYDRYFSREDRMTDEYVEAYDKAYEEEYNRAYDEGLLDTTPEPIYPIPTEAYHILSVAKNFTGILKNHLPQTNLPLVFALDSYYTDGPPEDDIGPIRLDETEFDTRDQTAPPTGDPSNLLIAALALSAAGVGAMSVRSAKKRKKTGTSR